MAILKHLQVVACLFFFGGVFFARAEAQQELKRWDVSVPGGKQYVLRMGSSRSDGRNPIEVCLSTSKICSEFAADFAGGMAPDAKLIDSGSGRWTRWESGSEEGWAQLQAAQIRLSDELSGVLLTQTSGFEHTHRIHGLFVASDGVSVREVWRGSEGQGPSWSLVEIYRPKGARPGQKVENFYFIEGSSNLEPDQGISERWNVQFLTWNSRDEGIQSSKDQLFVWAAIVGTFQSLKEAEAYRSGELGGVNRDCLRNFQILKTDDFKLLAKGKVVLAEMGIGRGTLEKSLALAKKCDPKIKGYLKRAI